MDNIIFNLRKFFGNMLDVFLGIFVLIWDKLSFKTRQLKIEIKEIEEELMLDEWNRGLIETLRFIMSPRAIIGRIFRFNVGELLTFLIGWGMIFSYFVIFVFAKFNDFIGILNPPLGPIAFWLLIGGIIISSCAYLMQAERWEKRKQRKTEQYRIKFAKIQQEKQQKTAEFLANYPEAEFANLKYGGDDGSFELSDNYTS